MSFALNLPENLQMLLSRIKSAGFLAYVVGGCVRDGLLGREIHDWDVTTNATPMEIKRIFYDCRTIDTGIQHGTVTVMMGDDTYEVTVFRVDGSYTDGRHPDQVQFTDSLTEDLARRDFTVNAMAYSPEEGIVDPFGGVEDAKKKVIRAVGNPTLRFTEDALRILRGVRFASVLGFQIEEQTAVAMLELSPRLALVSKERIATEMSKTLLGQNAKEMILANLPVMRAAWPMFRFDEEFLFGISLLPHLPQDLEVRLAALLSGAKDTLTKEILMQLRFSRETATAVFNLCQCDSRPLPNTLYEKKTLLGQYGDAFCQKLLALWLAKTRINGETPTQILEIAREWEKWEAENTCVDLSTLAVSGKDIQALGIAHGQTIGHCLSYLLRKVLQEELPNHRQILLSHLLDHPEVFDQSF